RKLFKNRFENHKLRLDDHTIVSQFSSESWPIFFLGTTVMLSLVIAVLGILLYREKGKVKLEKQIERKFTDLFQNASDLGYVHSLRGEILQINSHIPVFLGLSDNA